MKDFLYDIFIEPFTDDGWLGCTLGVLIWLLSLLIVGGLLCLSVWLIDSSFMPIKEKSGVVANKYIVPAHTTTNYIHSGKVLVPVTTFHKTKYYLGVSIDGLIDDVSVSDGYYDDISVGQKVHCKYTNGRITKALYIKSLE